MNYSFENFLRTQTGNFRSKMRGLQKMQMFVPHRKNLGRCGQQNFVNMVSYIFLPVMTQKLLFIQSNIRQQINVLNDYLRVFVKKKCTSHLF